MIGANRSMTRHGGQVLSNTGLLSNESAIRSPNGVRPENDNIRQQQSIAVNNTSSTLDQR